MVPSPGPTGGAPGGVLNLKVDNRDPLIMTTVYLLITTIVCSLQVFIRSLHVFKFVCKVESIELPLELEEIPKYV